MKKYTFLLVSCIALFCLATSSRAQTLPRNQSFSYDANGNMTEGWDGDKYSYTAEGKLKKVVRDGTTLVEFFYDHQGNRVKKIENGVITHYVGKDYEVTNGKAKKYYIINNAVVAEKDADGNKLYYHTDYLGSVKAITNEEKQVVWSGEYAPFGKSTTKTGDQNPEFGFTGQRYEDSIGISDYNARFYDARIKKFIQADTIVPDPTKPQSLDRYAYTLNNPLKYTDPTGHFFIPTFTDMSCSTSLSFICEDTLSYGAVSQFEKNTFIPYALAADSAIKDFGDATGVSDIYDVFAPSDPEDYGIESRLGNLAEGLIDIYSVVDTAVDVGTLGAGVLDNGLLLAAKQTVKHEVKEEVVEAGVKSLNWEAVPNRVGHVMEHGADKASKELHGIFNGNPVKMTDQAWSMRGGIEPIFHEGADVYKIPFKNAGIQGGYSSGAGEVLNNICIVCQTGTNNIITSYPMK